MSDFYRVQLDAFEGPMDLLLYLIRKHEVDLHDIPMSILTDQYLGFLDDLDTIDIDLAGEFLVTAATLMELKSRMLAASLDQVEETDDDESFKDSDTDPRPSLLRSCLRIKSTGTRRVCSVTGRKIGNGGLRCTARRLMTSLCGLRWMRWGNLRSRIWI